MAHKCPQGAQYLFVGAGDSLDRGGLEHNLQMFTKLGEKIRKQKGCHLDRKGSSGM